MQEDMPSNLVVLPCELVDDELQRCRLDAKLMKELGCCLRSPVKITLHQLQARCLCLAWPCDNEPSGYLYVSSVACSGKLVSRDWLCHRRKVMIRKDDIEVIPACDVTRVEITVAVRDYEEVGKYRNRDKLSDLTSDVRYLFQNHVIAEEFVLQTRDKKLGNILKISYICVENIAPSCQCGVVTSETEIVVKSVTSREVFEQRFGTVERPLLGGLDSELAIIRDLLQLSHKCKSWNLEETGFKMLRGVLLRGPPGCGKTSLVKYAAVDFGAHLLYINGAELFAARPGETEGNLRQMFHKAEEIGTEIPCVLFIDEIDTLCPRKVDKGSNAPERRVVSELCRLMDNIKCESHLVVIGATNRPGMIDPALRRPGRFEKEIFIGIPRIKQRLSILKVLMGNMNADSDVDLGFVSEATPGYTGADLSSLLQEAGRLAADQPVKGASPVLSQAHLKQALHTYVASTQRGSDVLVDHRPIAWVDIGGLGQVKVQIQQAVEWPLKHPDAFARLGLSRSRGVLLYGPPGCAKTMLVRAAATSCHVTFLAISGAQLYSPYVGDSEKKIAEVFQQARAGAPCILFIDELDSVVGSRAAGDAPRKGVQERVLSTLLNEMDGIGIRVEDLKTSAQPQERMLEGGDQRQEAASVKVDTVDNNEVLVVAATNRPDMIDSALLRPGRFDRIIYVPPPDLEARKAILEVHTRKTPVNDLDVELLASKTAGYTGADLENLVREAVLLALSEEGLDVPTIHGRYFHEALLNLQPSLTQHQLLHYAQLQHKLHR